MEERIGPFRLRAAVDEAGLYFVRVFLHRQEEPVYESSHFRSPEDARGEARLYARAVLVVACQWS